MNTKHIFLFFILNLILKTAFAQEVKLGLPVGHSSSLTSASFSPDKKTVVTSSEDNTARIWEVASGKLLHILEGHSDEINSVSYSPDGKTVVTASNDSTARIWEVASGKLLQTLVEHTSLVVSANYSPNGKTVLTVSRDNTARIWDVESGRSIQTLDGNHSASFSPDGKKVVTACWDKTARVWDVQTGQLLQTLKGHTSLVVSANFSPDGKTVVTASYDRKARVWEVASGNLLQTLVGHSGEVISASYSPNGKTVVTASYDRTARVWEVASGKLLQTLVGHTYTLNSASYSPNGKTAVTTALNDTARLWDVESGRQLHKEVNYGAVNSASFSSDGKTVVTACWDKTARIWDLGSGKPIQILEGHTNWVNSANYSPDGKTVITESDDNTAHVWDLASGKLIQTFEGNNSANYSPNGKTMVTAGWNNTAHVWDVVSGKLLHILVLDAYTSSVNGDNPFGHARKTVLPASVDTVRLWELESKKLFQTLKGQPFLVNSANYSPDGKNAITASMDNSVHVWEVTSGKLLQTLKAHTSSVNSAKYSPNGKTVVTASNDNTARIWDSASGELLQTLEGHTSYVNSAVYSSDGKTILTASEDHTAFLYDVAFGKIIQIFKGHTSSLTSASFSPDGKSILTASEDGSIIIWNTKTGQQLIRHLIFDADPNLWVHLHPSGLFDASPEAMELMYWTKGLEIIEFSQLKDRYWLPGLWEKVMKGEPLPDTRNMQELKLQPEVELGEVKDGKIPVTLTKREGGYGKVSILINGKEIEADARGNNFDKSKETQTVWVDLKDHPNLQNGENTIAVKASSEDGFVVGRPIEKKVTMSFQSAKPHFYAVVVGTGKYMNNSINLKYPEKDAESISKALQLGSEKLFGKENTHIYTLTTTSGERPTKEKIKNTFAEISQNAKSSDVILVYLSGHGITWGGDQSDFYYVTTDATAANSEAYNDEMLRKNHLISTAEFTEYLKVIPANKQVMIIDACSSGKAVENLMASRDIDVSQIKAIDRMKDRTGMFVISGSASDAVSYEASRYGQGLLTYSILQAMKGAALRDGQFFDVNTILNYSRENVPRLAVGIGGIQTPQLLIPKGGSFDIGQVDEEAKKQIPLSTIKPVFVRTTFVDAEDFTDVLSLSKSIDDQLNEIAIRGKESQIVFLDTREFPDAYRLSGGYTQSNGTISLKLKIKGPKESEHQLSGKTKEELIQQIMELVESLE